MNYLKTTVFLAALTALLLVIGNAAGGQTGLTFAVGLALIMNFSAYWFSDKIVLSIYRAQQVGPSEAPELYQIVNELARRAGLPMPKVYIIHESAPNAFATGRNPENAAVAATTGILQMLSRDELAGVIGHELSHVQHRDTLISTIAATIAGAIGMLANMLQWGMMLGMGRSNDRDEGPGVIGSLAAIILAPIAASLIQLAVSRSREYAADEAGAKLCGNPLWLANALRKLEMAKQQIPMGHAEQNPSTAHLFIVNPLSGKSIAQLFSTHPSTEERIRRLEEMASVRR